MNTIMKKALFMLNVHNILFSIFCSWFNLITYLSVNSSIVSNFAMNTLASWMFHFLFESLNPERSGSLAFDRFVVPDDWVDVSLCHCVIRNSA